MTKDNWIKAFDEWIKTQHGTAGWEMKLENFISQVEKDAIEKTNKRWREKIKDLQKIEEGMEHTDECYIGLSLDKDCICGRNKMYFALSDLLEEKK